MAQDRSFFEKTKSKIEDWGNRIFGKEFYDKNGKIPLQNTIFMILLISAIIMGNILLLLPDVYQNSYASGKDGIKAYTFLTCFVLFLVLMYGIITGKPQELRETLFFGILIFAIYSYIYVLFANLFGKDDSMVYALFILGILGILPYVGVFFKEVLFSDKRMTTKYFIFTILLTFGIVIGIIILLYPENFDNASLAQSYYTQVYCLLIIITFSCIFFYFIYSYHKSGSENPGGKGKDKYMIIAIIMYILTAYVVYSMIGVSTKIREGIMSTVYVLISILSVSMCWVIYYYVFRDRNVTVFSIGENILITILFLNCMIFAVSDIFKEGNWLTRSYLQTYILCVVIFLLLFGLLSAFDIFYVVNNAVNKNVRGVIFQWGYISILVFVLLLTCGIRKIFSTSTGMGIYIGCCILLFAVIVIGTILIIKNKDEIAKYKGQVLQTRVYEVDEEPPQSQVNQSALQNHARNELSQDAGQSLASQHDMILDNDEKVVEIPRGAGGSSIVRSRVARSRAVRSPVVQDQKQFLGGSTDEGDEEDMYDTSSVQDELEKLRDGLANAEKLYNKAGENGSSQSEIDRLGETIRKYKGAIADIEQQQKLKEGSS